MDVQVADEDSTGRVQVLVPTFKFESFSVAASGCSNLSRLVHYFAHRRLQIASEFILESFNATPRAEI